MMVTWATFIVHENNKRGNTGRALQAAQIQAGRGIFKSKWYLSSFAQFFIYSALWPFDRPWQRRETVSGYRII